MKKKIRIGVLISGGGSNLQAVIDACETGKISGELIFVGSDNPKADGLKRAAKHQIPSFVADYLSIVQQFKKDSAKRQLPDDFDLEDILAKQSLFGGQDDAEKVNFFLCTRAIAEHKLLNEMRPYPFDLLVLAGFMRNLTPYFIDYGEDTGAIIGQRTFPISGDDTLDSVRKKGLQLEWELYPECIQLFAEGRLKTVKKTFALNNGKEVQRTIVEILPPDK